MELGIRTDLSFSVVLVKARRPRRLRNQELAIGVLPDPELRYWLRDRMSNRRLGPSKRRHLLVSSLQCQLPTTRPLPTLRPKRLRRVYIVSYIVPEPTATCVLSTLRLRSFKLRRLAMIPPGTLMKIANHIYPPARIVMLLSSAFEASDLIVTETSNALLGVTKHAGWTELARGLK